MQANSLFLHTHTAPEGSQKFNTFFLKIVMLHIKLKGMEHRTPRKHIFCPYTHSRPLGWSQKVKAFYFLKVVTLHINLKGRELRAPCNHILCPYIHPQPVGRVKK